jgi:hypothetical protein
LRRGMISLHEEPSAHRPWTQTIVGFSDAGILLSCIWLPAQLGRQHAQAGALFRAYRTQATDESPKPETK